MTWGPWSEIQFLWVFVSYLRSRLQPLSCQHRAQCGTQTQEQRDHDLGQCWTLNLLSHLGAPICSFSFLSLFIYFGKRAQIREEQRERERERIPSRLHTVSTEPNAGLELTNREIMTWAKVGCLTDWATQVPHMLKLIIEKRLTKTYIIDIILFRLLKIF